MEHPAMRQHVSDEGWRLFLSALETNYQPNITFGIVLMGMATTYD